MNLSFKNVFSSLKFTKTYENVLVKLSHTNDFSKAINAQFFGPFIIFFNFTNNDVKPEFVFFSPNYAFALDVVNGKPAVIMRLFSNPDLSHIIIFSSEIYSHDFIDSWVIVTSSLQRFIADPENQGFSNKVEENIVGLLNSHEKNACLLNIELTPLFFKASMTQSSLIVMKQWQQQQMQQLQRLQNQNKRGKQNAPPQAPPPLTTNIAIKINHETSISTFLKTKEDVFGKANTRINSFVICDQNIMGKKTIICCKTMSDMFDWVLSIHMTIMRFEFIFVPQSFKGKLLNNNIPLNIEDSKKKSEEKDDPTVIIVDDLYRNKYYHKKQNKKLYSLKDYFVLNLNPEDDDENENENENEIVEINKNIKDFNHITMIDYRERELEFINEVNRLLDKDLENLMLHTKYTENLRQSRLNMSYRRKLKFKKITNNNNNIGGNKSIDIKEALKKSNLVRKNAILQFNSNYLYESLDPSCICGNNSEDKQNINKINETNYNLMLESMGKDSFKKKNKGNNRNNSIGVTKFFSSNKEYIPVSDRMNGFLSLMDDVHKAPSKSSINFPSFETVINNIKKASLIPKTGPRNFNSMISKAKNSLNEYDNDFSFTSYCPLYQNDNFNSSLLSTIYFSNTSSFLNTSLQSTTNGFSFSSYSLEALLSNEKIVLNAIQNDFRKDIFIHLKDFKYFPKSFKEFFGENPTNKFKPYIYFVNQLNDAVENIKNSGIKEIFIESKAGLKIVQIFSAFFLNGYKYSENCSSIIPAISYLQKNIFPEIDFILNDITNKYPLTAYDYEKEISGGCDDESEGNALEKKQIEDEMKRRGKERIIEKETSTFVAHLLNTFWIVPILKEIKREDKWINKYYNESSILCSDDTLNYVLDTILIIQNQLKISFKLETCSASSVLMNASTEFMIRAISTPAFGFLELNAALKDKNTYLSVFNSIKSYKKKESGKVAKQSLTLSENKNNSSIFSFISEGENISNYSKRVIIEKNDDESNSEEEFVNAVVNQFYYGLKTKYKYKIGPTSPISFILDVAYLANPFAILTSESQKALVKEKGFNDFVKASQEVLSNIVFAQRPSSLIDWIKSALDKTKLAQWLSFLILAKDINIKYYSKDSIFRDKYRANCAIAIILKYMKFEKEKKYNLQ